MFKRISVLLSIGSSDAFQYLVGGILGVDLRDYFLHRSIRT